MYLTLEQKYVDKIDQANLFSVLHFFIFGHSFLPSFFLSFFEFLLTNYSHMLLLLTPFSSICIFLFISIYLPLRTFRFISIYLSVLFYSYLSIYLCARFGSNLSIYLSVLLGSYQSIYLSICTFRSISIYPSTSINFQLPTLFRTLWSSNLELIFTCLLNFFISFLFSSFINNQLYSNELKRTVLFVIAQLGSELKKMHF